jgi:hypothetical protein
MLLTACAALGLLDKFDSRYGNSPLAEEFLVRGKPYYFGGWVQMLDQRLYPGWGRLTEAIRTNRPTTWDPDRQSSLFDGEPPGCLRCSGRRCTRCRCSPPARWARPSICEMDLAGQSAPGATEGFPVDGELVDPVCGAAPFPGPAAEDRDPVAVSTAGPAVAS